MSISAQELDEIRARCERATRGPWTSYIEGRNNFGGSSFIMVGTDDERGTDIDIVGATADDLDFIAHARQDIPRLLDEIRRLKGMLQLE